MSFNPQCDEECPQTPLLERLLEAFVAGAAPVAAAFLLNKLFPDKQEEEPGDQT